MTRRLSNGNTPLRLQKRFQPRRQCDVVCPDASLKGHLGLGNDGAKVKIVEASPDCGGKAKAGSKRNESEQKDGKSAQRRGAADLAGLAVEQPRQIKALARQRQVAGPQLHAGAVVVVAIANKGEAARRVLGKNAADDGALERGRAARGDTTQRSTGARVCAARSRPRTLQMFGRLAQRSQSWPSGKQRVMRSRPGKERRRGRCANGGNAKGGGAGDGDALSSGGARPTHPCPFPCGSGWCGWPERGR